MTMIGNSSKALPSECMNNETLLLVYLIPDDQRSELFYTSWQTVIITVLFPVISVFALIGNSSLLIVIVKIREMRTIANFYLGNLAVADLMTVSLGLIRILRLYYVSHGLVTFANIESTMMCVLDKLCVHIVFFASSGFVVLVSSERFYAICCPLEYRILSHNKKRALKYVASTWIIAIGIALVISPAWSKVDNVCVIWDINGAYNIFFYCESVVSRFQFQEFHALSETIYFFLAFVTSTVFYIFIVNKLRKRQTICYNGSQQVRAKAMTNQVAKMVIINGLVFFLCQAPYNIHLVLYTYTDGVFLTKHQISTLGWITRLLHQVNSSANPLIYTTLSSRYRQAFVQTFCHKFKVGKQRRCPAVSQKEDFTRF